MSLFSQPAHTLALLMLATVATGCGHTPPALPDNHLVRTDLAAQYMAWSRLDAGVGLMLSPAQVVVAHRLSISINR